MKDIATFSVKATNDAGTAKVSANLVVKGDLIDYLFCFVVNKSF